MSLAMPRTWLLSDLMLPDDDVQSHANPRNLEFCGLVRLGLSTPGCGALCVTPSPSTRQAGEVVATATGLVRGGSSAPRYALHGQ